jgi:polyribonucleotide nucleotidyltransferase
MFKIKIVCNLLSYSGQDSPDILCINTVSFALHHSNLLWNGPIGCVRVGMIDNEFITNPSKKQLEKSPLNLVLSIDSNQNICNYFIIKKN